MSHIYIAFKFSTTWLLCHKYSMFYFTDVVLSLRVMEDFPDKLSLQILKLS